MASQGLVRAGAVIRQRWRRSAEELMAEAWRRAELEDDQLLERLLATAARQELLASALEGAAHSTDEGKIKANWGGLSERCAG